MRLLNKELLKEIRFIVCCAFCMDIILIAAGAFFVSFINALCGAVYGTLLLTVDLFLLSLSVQSVAKGAKKGKNGSAKMTALYVLRMAVLFVCMLAALKASFISIVCTAVPLFYPKLIYPFKSILRKKEG